MALERQKRASRIQRDEHGRLILNRGPFADKVVLTEEQADELQPILDDFYIWGKRLQRRMMPFIMLMGIVVPIVASMVPKEQFMTVVFATILSIAPVGVGMQISYMKQPGYRAFRRLHRELHRNAPRV